jgi:hypothetical protein
MRDKVRESWLVGLVTLACAVLAQGASLVAQAGESIPTPPPICDIGRLTVIDPAMCPDQTHAEVHWPRHCPEELTLDDGDVKAVIYCRPTGTPPLAAIYCTPSGVGAYECEAEPAAIDGSLSYRWQVGPGLAVVVDEEDRSVAHVSCVSTPGAVGNYLTMSVLSTDGTSATVTGSLSCISPR